MKTIWHIIHKEISNLANGNNITSLRINNHIIHNQIRIANELNNYFLKKAGSRNNNKITKKEEVASPLQRLLQYFNQTFKDTSWPYTSSKEIII